MVTHAQHTGTARTRARPRLACHGACENPSTAMGLLAHTEAAVKAVTALVIVLVILALLGVLQRVLEERDTKEKDERP